MQLPYGTHKIKDHFGLCRICPAGPGRGAADRLASDLRVEFPNMRGFSRRIASAREYRPDLIVLDFGLPDTNGLQVALRKREFSDAHILALTGRTDMEDAILAAGVNEFMVRPFNVRELRERVKTALGVI